MKAKVIVAVIGALLLVGAVVYKSTCACVTLVEGGGRILRREMQRMLDAEQAYLQLHGRFAGTLDELAYSPDSTVTLRFTVVSDSSLTVVGSWVTLPNVTCTLAVTPATRGIETVQCGP